MSEDKVFHIAIEGRGSAQANGHETPPVTPEPPARAASVVDMAATGEAELKDRWLRAEAEIKNVRKRAAQDVRSARRAERETVLRALLPVADNLERALQAEGEDGDLWMDGIRAVRRQLSETLRALGAEPFGPEDEMFDPRRHEAVSTANLPHAPDGAIVEVLQVGYQMKDGVVLRPAQVVVAQTPKD